MSRPLQKTIRLYAILLIACLAKLDLRNYLGLIACKVTQGLLAFKSCNTILMRAWWTKHVAHMLGPLGAQHHFMEIMNTSRHANWVLVCLTRAQSHFMKVKNLNGLVVKKTSVMSQ